MSIASAERSPSRQKILRALGSQDLPSLYETRFRSVYTLDPKEVLFLPRYVQWHAGYETPTIRDDFYTEEYTGRYKRKKLTSLLEDKNAEQTSDQLHPYLEILDQVAHTITTLFINGGLLHENKGFIVEEATDSEHEFDIAVLQYNLAKVLQEKPLIELGDTDPIFAESGLHFYNPYRERALKEGRSYPESIVWVFASGMAKFLKKHKRVTVDYDYGIKHEPRLCDDFYLSTQETDENRNFFGIGYFWTIFEGHSLNFLTESRLSGQGNFLTNKKPLRMIEVEENPIIVEDYSLGNANKSLLKTILSDIINAAPVLYPPQHLSAWKRMSDMFQGRFIL